jgi:hypothetical protein
VVEEAAAPGVVQRPALGVDDAAGLVLVGIDVPQLLEADAVDLRLAPESSAKIRFSSLVRWPRAPSAKRV